jgi:RNA polymerase sigma factor for flagellar operon FliA
MEARAAISVEADAWRRFKVHGDQQARAWIIERYAGVVRTTARRFIAFESATASLEDMIAEGSIGLVRAVDQFDPARGVKFRTYAITWIRGMILELLRLQGVCPRTMKGRLEARGKRPLTPEISSSIADEGPLPQEIAEQGELTRLLLVAMERLTRRERYVLLQYYVAQRAAWRIAETLKLSESRVFQIRNAALGQLKFDRGLRDFVRS